MKFLKKSFHEKIIFLLGTVDYKIVVGLDDIYKVKEFCQFSIQRGCREDTHQALSAVMQQRGLQPPTSSLEAISLYRQIISLFPDEH